MYRVLFLYFYQKYKNVNNIMLSSAHDLLNKNIVVLCKYKKIPYLCEVVDDFELKSPVDSEKSKSGIENAMSNLNIKNIGFGKVTVNLYVD